MRARRAIVIGLTAALGGCVLLIDEIETQDHCGIQGSGVCVDCIRNSCQELVDKCCASSACTTSTILNEMDACGRGRTDECSKTLAVGKPVEEQDAIRECVARSCQQPCTTGEAGTSNAQWTCDTARGTTNACATCVYGSCVDSIDECCGDPTCKSDSSIQKDIGACVGGDQPGCSFLLDDSRGTAGKAGVVRKCIQTSCMKECLGNGLPHTKCTLQSGGDYCQCTNSETSGTQTCREETVSGDCVLGKDGCSCGQYACTDVSRGCTCAFRGGVVGTSCTKPNIGFCCVKRGAYGITCECKEGTAGCTESIDEVDISSCSREDVIAWAGAAVVGSCSR